MPTDKMTYISSALLVKEDKMTDKKNVLYVGFELIDKDELIKLFHDEKKRPKLYTSHITLAFRNTLTDEQLKWANERLGDEYIFEVTEFGESIGVGAVKVVCSGWDIPWETGKVAHITIDTDGKTPPKNSGDIKDWKKLEKSVQVKTKVNIWTKNGKII